MPYSCALAVCTTFCFRIAAALIPIFGPDFPEKCIPPESPEYGRMIIDPAIIETATAEAELFRLRYGCPKSYPGGYSPEQSAKSEPYQDIQGLSSPQSLGRRTRLRRALTSGISLATCTGTDFNGTDSIASSPGGSFNSHDSASNVGFSREQTWKQHNVISHSANSSVSIGPLCTTFSSPSPWLSAIPRSTYPEDFGMERSWTTKRQLEDEREDDAYEGEESGSITDDRGSVCEKESENGIEIAEFTSQGGAARKEAAWLLMQLSIHPRQDQKSGTSGIVQESCSTSGPRVKRRRAVSL